MTTREAINRQMEIGLTNCNPRWLDEMWAFAVETGNDTIRDAVEAEIRARGIYCRMFERGAMLSR